MKVGIFQMHGCDKCFAESMLLGGDHHVERFDDPSKWNGDKMDVAIITGYMTGDDVPTIQKISEGAGKLVAFGSCAATGGPYGLSYQRGNDVRPLEKVAAGAGDAPAIDVINVEGCLGEAEELEAALWGKLPNGEKLCPNCPRRPTCDFLDEVVRQVELEKDDDTCFNDLGLLCNGFIARDCKEKCIEYGTPCRGCKPLVRDSGFRMLGMFATLMANVEVATEATGKGGTDKLADDPDDLTRSVPDVTGSFFRFCLPTSRLPIGKAPSQGAIIPDIMTGRPLEELPLLAGLIGGTKSISLTIDTLEAYEKGAGLEVSPKVKELRDELRALEKDLQAAVTKSDIEAYRSVTSRIRAIAGNMNLSNLFFGGFKMPIDGVDDFDECKARVFEVQPGEYSSGAVQYSLDADGIVTKFNWMEG